MSKESSDLKKWRERIDECDRELIEILARRFAVTKEVGWYKAEHGLPPMDKQREDEKFAVLTDLAYCYGLDDDMVKDIFGRIIREVKEDHRRSAERQ